MNKNKQAPVVSSKVQAQPPKLSWKDRLSQVDYEELQSVFNLFDEDGGGTIDPVEIQKILEELGLKGRNPVVFEMINSLRDVGHPVKFEEFLEIICSKVGDVKSKEGITKVFQIWDPENNGFVDFESFKRIARQLGQTLNDEQLTEMMHNSYINNGTESHDSFSFEEFYSIVSKKRN